MALSVDERLSLLSIARASSRASIDTIGDSALVAFLQVQDSLRSIGSRAATVSAIDVLLPRWSRCSPTTWALPVVQLGGRRVLARVANSRVVVGKLVNDITGVRSTTTTRPYGGVQKRFTFSTYADVLASHRSGRDPARLAGCRRDRALRRDHRRSPGDHPVAVPDPRGPPDVPPGQQRAAGGRHRREDLDRGHQRGLVGGPCLHDRRPQSKPRGVEGVVPGRAHEVTCGQWPAGR